MTAYSHNLYYLKSFLFPLNVRSIALAVLFVLLTKLIVIFAKCVKLRWKLHGMMPGTVYSWYNPLGLCGEVMRHKNFKNVESINSVLLEIAKEKVEMFKEHSVLLTWIACSPLVTFIKADAAEVLFRNEDKVKKPWHYSMVKDIFGNGLLTSSGNDWKYQRKLLNPCFHNDVLKGFLPDFNEYAQLLVDTIRTNNKGDFLRIGQPVGLCVLEILLSTIFGVKLRNDKEDGINYMESTKKLIKMSYARGFNVFHWSAIIYGLSRHGREADFHLRRMRHFTDTIIKERKGEVSKETESGGKKKMALMDFLIRHQLETDELTDQNIREQVDTFVAAGLGTTRVSICWTLYLLGQHKDVQEKVHQELDEVFSDNRGGPITLDEVNKLKYLDRVLKECKRLYPPVPGWYKTLGKDISVRGSTIPKGSTCFVLTYFIHRDEEQYQNPDSFDPDRFLPENCTKRHPFSFLPFSMGHRTCIGAKFSEIQEKVILSTLLKQFTVESENQDDKVPSLSMTLGSSVPIRIKFTTKNN